MSEEMLLRATGIKKRFSAHSGYQSVFSTVSGWLGGSSSGGFKEVLRGVDLEVARGDRVGVIGVNGCGKTTLLRVLSGIYSPTDGRLESPSEPASLLRFGLTVGRDVSLQDNIRIQAVLQGMSRRWVIKAMEEILDFSGLRELRGEPVRVLSAGQAQRLMLGVFLHLPHELLILDESFVYMDEWFTERYLQRFETVLRRGAAVLFTSHDHRLLNRICSRGLWLDGGRVLMEGPIEEVLAAYGERESLKGKDGSGRSLGTRSGGPGLVPTHEGLRTAPRESC